MTTKHPRGPLVKEMDASGKRAISLVDLALIIGPVIKTRMKLHQYPKFSKRESYSYRFYKISFRLFVPCLLLVVFLDVKGWNSLRNSPFVRDYVNGTSVTEIFGTSLSTSPDMNSSTASENKDAPGQDALKIVVQKEAILSKSKTTTTTTTCLDPNGPKPYILLARGRSGSGSTMQVLGKLTPGEFIPGDFELTGSSPKEIRELFASIGPNDGGKWVADFLCEQQKKYPNAGLVAFKWKPYSEAMFSPAALAGLDLISRAVDPMIKVIRLRRNLLDNFISDKKHEIVRVRAHCQHGNLRCITRHKKAGTNLTLSVPELLAFLEAETTQEDTVDKFLVNMSVPHVHVSYEKLYHQDNAEEWMRIFRFLGVGPAEGLTREQVDGNAHVYTGSSHHREAILNYDEVEKGLKGTRFESLLRP